VPSPEPDRSGGARPGTSSGTAEHTVNAVTADTAPPGYSPAQMTAHLGLTGDGAGQTIAIVDAYDDPDITSDAQTFSAQYGLPGVCGAGGAAGDCFKLDVREQDPAAGSDGNWAVETSLDVEWAHAVAPRASIELVEASDASFAALFKAVATASASRPAVISMSWGLPGEFTDETYYDHFCQLSDSLCVVSTGDFGHPGDYPAYNPSVLAIGGTSLTLGDDGSVQGEIAWSSSGGGQSYVEPTPAYQAGVVSGGRGTPDVSFDADPSTGVPVYDTTPDNGQSGWFEVGGTSVGAPAWSAILSVTDQLRAASGRPALVTGTAQKTLYGSAGALSDVASGQNGQCPVCTAGTGYDFVTGLGSPLPGIDGKLNR
jgi:subtilase family serine protease